MSRGGGERSRRRARRPMRLAGVAVLLATTVGGCTGAARSSPENPAPYDPESVSFAPSLEVELGAMRRTSAGLYLQDLVEGAGATAQATSFVTLHYVGYLPDGTVFDASSGGEPFQFRLGGDEVIRGWSLGIPGMRRGGVRRLVVRPALGYRSRPMGRIPPNTTLVFDIQLLEVR